MADLSQAANTFADPNFVLHGVEFRVTKLNPARGHRRYRVYPS